MALANSRQQQRLVSQAKALQDLYMKFNCGTISVIALREGISDLEIQETHSLRRLLNQGDGSNLKYSEFLLSLKHIDEEDMKNLQEFRTPVKATAQTATPFATMHDVLNMRHEQVEDTNANDILTWSTPEKEKLPPSRKKKTTTSFTESPIPVYEAPSYSTSVTDEEFLSEELPPFTPKERNALIQAYLAGSIDKNSFLEQLNSRCGITSSENLEHLIACHEQGKNVRFLDLCKEIATLLEKISFKKIVKVKPPPETRRANRATIDIFDMENAVEEKRVPVPHSKEQISSMRKQKNIFTWDDSEEEPTTPSRRLGVGAYQGTNDLFDQTPEEPNVKPSLRPRNATAEGCSGDIFGWTTPPKPTEPKELPGKKASLRSPVAISAIPWGTQEDYMNCEENPHAHNITKRL